MKINNPILYCLLFFAILFFSCKKTEEILDESNQLNQPNLSNIDTLDHQSKISSISTVTIDNQIWMTKNLDVVTFRNGDTIFEAKTEEDWKKASKFHIPAYCYYDNDSENRKKYGCLYNWYAVMDERSLAPLGFHIPNNEEYNFLLSNLGLKNNPYHGQEIAHNIASKLKSTSKLWTSIMDRNNKTATNSSGFSALPGGVRYEFGSFNSINEYGFWWSSENNWQSNFNQVNTYITNPSDLSINYWVSRVGAGSFKAGTGLSVRCIKGEVKRTTKIPILKNEFLELEEDGKPREGTWTFDDSSHGVGGSVTKTFVNGVENGVRLTYDRYNQLLSHQMYKYGMLNGESSEVNFHGEITESGNYHNGKKVGVWTKYKWINRRMDGSGAVQEIESTENFDEK
tara:strand:+ start:280 stop:1473 length:1194 start_codon:yes stop_codon:yes gene_type:complete